MHLLITPFGEFPKPVPSSRITDMDFTSILLEWYRKHKRDLPWRKTRDPYLVWVSEIILQQTRIDQGLPYYDRFTETFPDVFRLAGASEQEVLTAWQGLGYYTRARNMHTTARIISGQFRGQFPQTTAGLRALKGIGTYTAAAIASICFDVAEPVVDGNVIRFLSRFFGIDAPAGTARSVKEISARASGLISLKNPGDFNQALMEFGATMCIPSRPSCTHCPFAAACVARRTDQVETLPVRLPKPALQNRYLYYFFAGLTSGGRQQTLLRHRTEKDIWRNLYDFPCLETDSALTDLSFSNLTRLFQEAGLPVSTITHVSGEYVHLLSHQRLIVRFCNGTVQDSPSHTFQPVLLDELHLWPMPRLLRRYLDGA